MKQYLDLLRDIEENGVVKEDRTGVGTKSVFGRQLRFDLTEGFPLLTTKFVHFHSVLHELLWFLDGGTNVYPLRAKGVTIWDEWADSKGNLGLVYGHQWRNFGAPTFAPWAGIDQIDNVVRSIAENPDSRRHIVSAWSPKDVDQMALPPCHMIFQFVVTEGKLSCMMTMRSVDVFLGLPFNIASYALLTHLMARTTDLEVGDLIISTGDTHRYLNHEHQVKRQLTRQPESLPALIVKNKRSIDKYEEDDIELVGYNPQSKIPAPIAV